MRKMAAKQGITAQIYQASEDTKRSLLSRAPAGIKGHSWLSNLNTTCTIKSAPPRTPEVMSLLSSKCGWLVKRNEQHVWQKRWCCVVPHTFLYYFEASPEIKADEDGNYEGWSGGGINIKGVPVNTAQVIAVGPLVFQNLDQDALNAAVKEGYDENGPIIGGSSKARFYASLPNIIGGAAAGNGYHNVAETEPDNVLSNDWEESPLSMEPENKGTYQFVSSSNLQPVGIIDLECYSAVNRSKINPTVLELAGDVITNPDLRSFYFQAATIEDAESWIKALLSDRHHSLKDETEAYRQVCDSFPLQLQACSEMIDAAEAKSEAIEKELYSVRSAAEEGRRKVVSTVREVLERQCWVTEASTTLKQEQKTLTDFENCSFPGRNRRSDYINRSKPVSNENESSLIDSVIDTQYAKLEINREAFIKELDLTLSSSSTTATSNVLPPVQTLADYLSAIVASFTDLRAQLRKCEKDLCQSVDKDQTQLQALKSEIHKRDSIISEAEKKHAHMSSELKSKLDLSRRELEEMSKQLDTQRMEFSMYQNATKSKVSELHQHKKILKKEVIELRKKIDECGSESTTVAHQYEKMKHSYQAEKERNSTLERYIERLEKQVGVQQNMMEMMSQTGGGSFVGKMVGPGVNNSDTKDAISLSGMSLGSQYRHMSSSNSIGIAGQSFTVGTHGITQSKPRQLLPPESSKQQKSNPEVDPPRTLNVPRENDIGDIFVDEIDVSVAYCHSEGTAQTTLRGDDTESLPTERTRPFISTDEKDLGQDDNGLSPLSLDDPVLATRSTETMKTPMSPKDIVNRTSNVYDTSKTPIQSNLDMNDTTALVDKENTHDFKLQDIPNLDTHIEEPTNNLPPVADFPPTDPDLDDDMDDIKSRVSDITEDRTQRQIDDDLAERRKILLAYVQGNAERSSNILKSSNERRLETIQNIIPNTGGSSTSRNSVLPRTGSLEDLESYDGSSKGSGRLSVAQKARLEAENRANIHRAPSPLRPKVDTTVSSEQKSSLRSLSSASSLGETIEKSGSFFSKLGRAIENVVDNSVLGVKTWESELDEDDDRSESEVASVGSTTLQERIAKQREKQVEFLKNKGLLEDESSLRGGAGGSSIGSVGAHRPSPVPAYQAPPRRGIGRKW